MTIEPDWLEAARETGLAITHKSGIKEVDGGRDRALCLNEVGLKVLRRALERAYQQGIDRASDGRPTGPRPTGLGGDSSASAVDGATSDGEAPDLLDELDDAASVLRSNDAAYCADVVDQAAQTISDLMQERDALREALRPFAKAGGLFGPRGEDEWDQAVYSPAAGKEYGISGDDLRRARTLLSQSPEGE